LNHIRSPPMFLKVNQDAVFPQGGTPRNLMNIHSPSLNLSNLNNVGSNRSSFSHNFNLNSPPNEMNMLEGTNQNSSMMFNEYSGIMTNGYSSPRSFNHMNFNQFPINTIQKKFHQYEGKRSK
jgi:hypothetical protein